MSHAVPANAFAAQVCNVTQLAVFQLASFDAEMVLELEAFYERVGPRSVLTRAARLMLGSRGCLFGQLRITGRARS
jgi:hypothetical protein